MTGATLVDDAGRAAGAVRAAGALPGRLARSPARSRASQSSSSYHSTMTSWQYRRTAVEEEAAVQEQW